MGTKGSYDGGGGKPGRDLRRGAAGWLDGQGDSPPDGSPPDARPPDQQPDAPTQAPQRPNLPPQVLRHAAALFRSASGGGGGGGGAAGQGGGGGGGGARRSSRQSAASAGRAAAGAYAFRTGNVEVLENLGLDYAQLLAIDDPIERTRRIVEAACGPLSNGTIEDEEQRLVAAEITQWVLEENRGAAPPDPAEIVRETVAQIIFEAATSEIAVLLRQGNHSPATARELERQIRDAAQALAEQADFTPSGATPREFAQAIEQGIETLKVIFRGA